MSMYHLSTERGKRYRTDKVGGIWPGLAVTMLVSLCWWEAAAQSIPQQIETYAAQLRQSRSAAVPATLREVRNAKEVIEAAPQFFNDTLPLIRERMYMLAADAGAQTKDPDLRRQVVTRLVNATADVENLDLLLSRLSAFQAGDFSPPARDTLAALFRKDAPYQDELARLCGAIGIQKLLPDLQALSGPATKNQRLRWAALLALARMGDAEALSGVMKRVQRLPVSDDLVYEVFPDLIYTRQRAAIDYLVVELNSDEKKCTTADERPVTCAYRIMEMLAGAVEKYPLRADAGGDIKTNDYEKSLAAVRQWFKKNKEYQIKQ